MGARYARCPECDRICLVTQDRPERFTNHRPPAADPYDDMCTGSRWLVELEDIVGGRWPRPTTTNKDTTP